MAVPLPPNEQLMRLKGTHVKVLIALAQHADANDCTVDATQDAIAAEIGLSRGSVWHAVKALQAGGWLAVDASSRGARYRCRWVTPVTVRTGLTLIRPPAKTHSAHMENDESPHREGDSGHRPIINVRDTSRQRVGALQLAEPLTESFFNAQSRQRAQAAVHSARARPPHNPPSPSTKTSNQPRHPAQHEAGSAAAPPGEAPPAARSGREAHPAAPVGGRVREAPPAARSGRAVGTAPPGGGRSVEDAKAGPPSAAPPGTTNNARANRSELQETRTAQAETKAAWTEEMHAWALAARANAIETSGLMPIGLGGRKSIAADLVNLTLAEVEGAVEMILREVKSDHTVELMRFLAGLRADKERALKFIQAKGITRGIMRTVSLAQIRAKLAEVERQHRAKGKTPREAVQVGALKREAYRRVEELRREWQTDPKRSKFVQLIKSIKAARAA